MNGKTHTIRRRLSVIALTASLAAIAIPAANAGGVLGPGLNTVEKQGPYGAYWIRKHEAARVLGPGLNTVEKRGPYGAYWVSKSAQKLNEPSMDEVHLYPRGSADNDIFKSAALEHGANGFLGQSTKQVRVNIRLPRADDPMFREIVQEAAQEHGATGFGNGLDLRIGLIRPVRVTVVRDGGDATGSKLSLSWKPVTVDYSHLPQEERFGV